MLVAAALAAGGGSSVAWAYIPQARWSTTASGSTGAAGRPITLTWSLVPNGTSIANDDPSNLISYLDGKLGAGPGGGDLTKRPWFNLISESFGRWSALGGINFIYEPRDDGAILRGGAGSTGVLGVRGDIRLGGAPNDGPSGTLAYANYPNNGDIVLDTSETDFFTNPAFNYRAFRNTLMHEIGHAFGLAHIDSSNAQLLMEPFINSAFDGPQLDDIRGIQGQYGDANEKTFGGQGNDAFSRATSLGAIANGASRSVGADAAGSQAVLGTEIDFVSIANSADFDFYSFSVTSPSVLSAALTPLGGVFSQGQQNGAQSSFNANARNDLSLTVYGLNGVTSLGLANNSAAGFSESLTNIALSAAGQYYVRVSGTDDFVQPYQLQLSVVSSQQPSADFDGDGDVDGRDFLALQRGFGSSAPGDANHDGVVNSADVSIFRQQFGAPSLTPRAGSVPEPSATCHAIIAAALRGFGMRRRRRRRSSATSTKFSSTNLAACGHCRVAFR